MTQTHTHSHTHRHNQELEQDALATEQEKAKLQQEADSLAQQLEAVLLDKFATSGTSFDADTPIDKTMKFLQSIIMVSSRCASCTTLSCSATARRCCSCAMCSAAPQPNNAADTSSACMPLNLHCCGACTNAVEACVHACLLVLAAVLQGGAPKVQAALELYSILSESNIDLRQPVGLEEQLLKDEALDSEVGQSMLQLLQVPLADLVMPCCCGAVLL